MNKAEYIIDRTILRRKLTIWRIIAIVAIVLGIVAVGASDKNSYNIDDEHIARITINGTILHDTQLIELIREVQDDENVKAVIVSINSPGGTTVGGESIFNAITELQTQKPTIASINTIATSAAYLIAIATEYVVAHHTSIVGSIGVLMQYPQVDKMLENFGIEMKEIKSTPLKAAPSPFKPDDPIANQMIQNVINDSYKWFRDIVQNRRQINQFEIQQIADGSIYTGNQAKELNLIDEIGGEEIALQWLHDNKNIEQNLEIIDREIEHDDTLDILLAKNIISSILNKIGIYNQNNNIILDGLISIWQK